MVAGQRAGGTALEVEDEKWSFIGYPVAGVR